MSPATSSLLTVFGLWILLAMLCCGGGRYGAANTYRVTYRVDGAGDAHVTYSNATGGTEMRQVNLPWTETFDGRYGEHLYLSAQGGKGYGGDIVSSISVNGRVVKDATSNGEFAIATVSDRCCGE